MTVEVVGCDVARGRWVAVALDRDGFARALVRDSLADVVGAVPSAAVVVVDIPIGLPTDGPRAADLQAREAVGARRSSVFVTPVRAAIEEPDHARASRANAAATGKGVSRQAHALRRMILDAGPVAARDERVHEGHPEVSFAALAGHPLADAKTSWNGLHARLRLLAGAGIELPRHLAEAGGVAPDDLVDAAVLAWTGRRIASGRARRFGDPQTRTRDHAIHA